MNSDWFKYTFNINITNKKIPFICYIYSSLNHSSKLFNCFTTNLKQDNIDIPRHFSTYEDGYELEQTVVFWASSDLAKYW